MFAISRIDQRHVRATAMLVLLALLVFLAGGATHVVQRGETLGEIALDHGVTVRALVRANDIADPDVILIGRQLLIPGTDDPLDISKSPTVAHTVSRGDLLALIARDHGVSVSAIVVANSIDNANLIHPGQLLVIPGPGTAGVEVALYHVVREGDSLSSIAARHGISVEDLAKANGMTATSVIAAGIRLRLTPAEPFEPQGVGTIDYIVVSGDRVGDVALEHGTTISEIIRLNHLTDANLIRPDQVLEIPAGGWICPVPGASFGNDWGFPRSGERFHEGTDLFARRGAEVRAPVAGVVTQLVGSIGGLQFTLRGDDGHTYYGSHMDSFGDAGRVAAGAFLGTVGDSGNARGARPHLHFEIYPNGAEPVNPYPTLLASCGRDSH